jgi:hypothetical protein
MSNLRKTMAAMPDLWGAQCQACDLHCQTPKEDAFAALGDLARQHILANRPIGNCIETWESVRVWRDGRTTREERRQPFRHPPRVS